MLAVDMGSRSIRVAEFVCDRKGRWHLRDWLQVPRGNDADATVGLPKGRFRGHRRLGFHTARRPPAVTCVSACDVTVRELAVPSTFSHNDIRDVLENENPFPQALSDLCVDYQVVSQDPREMRLRLAAVPRRLVDERTRQLTAMGLNPIAVAVDVFALQQLLGRLTQCPAESDTSQLFILIDHARFALYVMQAGELIYTRRHPLSSPEVAAAAREIARAVQLFAVSSVMGGVARLILAGSYTDIETLSELLAATSGLAVQVLDAGAVITNLPASFDTTVADQRLNLHSLTLAFALIIGLGGAQAGNAL